MRNEIGYIKELVLKLEEFFRIKDLKKKIEIAQDLNDNWGFDCRDYSKIPDWSKKACGIPLEDNSKVSKEVEEISGMLGVLHHYEEDSIRYDEYIRSILNKSRKFLKKVINNKPKLKEKLKS